MTLKCQRSEFEIPREVCYLNAAGIGPLSKKTLAAGERGLQAKAQPWQIGPDHFFGDLEKVRHLLSQFLHTSAENIAIIPSATYGVEVAAKNILLKPGEEILLLQDEFPALVLPLKRRAHECGAILRFVERPASFDWTQAFLKALKPQTRVVALGSCHWYDGSSINLEEVSRQCKKHGILLILDLCQSLGVSTFNINKIQPDYVVAPFYKWFLGPYTYACLYVSPAWQEKAKPLEEYWANRLESDNFMTLTKYEERYQPGARKFDMSERSQFTSTPMVISTLEQMLQWDPQSIAAYLQPMIQEMANELQKKGFAVIPAEFRSSHMLGFTRAEGFSEDFKAHLLAKNIHVSFRGEWLRVAPHIYNNHQDIEIFLNGVVSF